MTKSRMALLILAAGAAAWPGAAFAQSAAPSAPATAERVIAAYDIWYEEITNGAGARTVRRCRRDEAAGDEDIVVCGRTDSRVRVDYDAVEGEVHHIAGDIPSGRDALAAADRCMRLCNVGVMIPIIPTIEALGRGLERLLHPD